MAKNKMKNSKKVKVKGESKRHEDKIANVLKSMKEKKEKKRVSVENRLQRMERLVKKQEKAGLVRKKCQLPKKTNVAVKVDQKTNINSPQRNSRAKVPTAKFLEYQEQGKRPNSKNLGQNKDSSKSKADRSEKLKKTVTLEKKSKAVSTVEPRSPKNIARKKDSSTSKEDTNEEPKEKVTPEKKSKAVSTVAVEPRSPRVRVQTPKFLEFKNKSSKSLVVNDRNKLESTEAKSSPLIVKPLEKRSLTVSEETKRSLNKVEINRKEEAKIQTGTKAKRQIEEPADVSSIKRVRDRVRVPTSKFVEYQKSLSEENDNMDKNMTNGKVVTKNLPNVKLVDKNANKPSSSPGPQSSGKGPYCERKRMMDEILNAHYAQMKSSPTPNVEKVPLKQNIPNGAAQQLELGRTPTSRKPVDAVEKTLAELKDYIYIKVDDEISIKSPVKPTTSFARFIAGQKVTHQERRKMELELSKSPSLPAAATNSSKQAALDKERKFRTELSRYQKIAPKSLGNSKERLVGSEMPSYIPCHLCEYVTMSMTGFEQHVLKRHPHSSPITEFFHFPNFLGFNCSLRNSRFQLIPYYVTEVTQPQKNGFFPMPENLSQTCLFFIPQRTLGQFSELTRCSNILIPYESHTRGFTAHFPNTPDLAVSWATNISSAELCVGQLQMFILTKSRFKLIQSVRSGRDKAGPGGGYGGFCQFTDQEKIALESAVRMQTEPMVESMAPTSQENSPQVILDKYNCPFPDCEFVSDRKFSGVRNHFLKHFKEQIEAEAKPRAFLTEREKSNCMSKTGCSVAILTARGELVHHFGIFHCAVDDLFQDFAFRWLQEKYPSHFFKNLCPYEDYTYENETDFLEHLSSTHYFNAILSEVEDMVKFSLTYFEEYKCMANMYKCPFCKKKFQNLADGSNVRDVKEMVLHCGVDHGFALYYLMSDQNITKMRQLLNSVLIKEEPVDEDDPTADTNMIDPESIKLEPMEETETEINNFLEVEMYDSCGDSSEDV